MHEAALVKQHQAFAVFVARREARALGVPEADMEDIVQESMIGLVQTARAWDPEKGAFTTLAGWKCRAACQKASRVAKVGGVHRRSKLKPIVVGLPREEFTVDPWATVEEADHRLALLDTIEAAIASLSNPDRNVLLKWSRAESVAALAAEDGVSRQAVDRKLRRALRRVREAVAA